MSIIVIDPTTALAIRAAMDGPNGTREAGVITAAAAAFGGGNVTIEVFDAAGVLLHTMVRGPWTTDTNNDVKLMLAGAVVSRTNHASGNPASAKIRTTAGLLIFQTSAGLANSGLTFAALVDVNVRIDAGSLVFTAPTTLDTVVDPPTGDTSLFVTSETMAELVAMAQANHAAWVGLKTWCNAYLGTVWNTSNWAGTAESIAICNYALAYMIGVRAGEAQATAWGDEAIRLWHSAPTYAPPTQVHAFWGPKYRRAGTWTCVLSASVLPSGTFPVGATVRGRTSGVTAEVVCVAWKTSPAGALAALRNFSGNFQSGETCEVVGDTSSTFVFTSKNRVLADADDGYGSRYFSYLYGAMYFWMEGHPGHTDVVKAEVRTVAKDIWDEFDGINGVRPQSPILGIGNYQFGHMTQEVVFGLILREHHPTYWTEALRRFRARTNFLRDHVKSSGWLPEGGGYGPGMNKELAFSLLALKSVTTESISDYDAFARNVPVAMYMGYANSNTLPFFLDDGYVGEYQSQSGSQAMSVYQRLYGPGSLQSKVVAAIFARKAPVFHSGNQPHQYWPRMLTHLSTETFSSTQLPLSLGTHYLMAKSSHDVGGTSVWMSAGPYYNDMGYQRRDQGSLRIARAKPLLVTAEYNLKPGWGAYPLQAHQSYPTVHGRTTTTTIQQYQYNAGYDDSSGRAEIPAAFTKPDAECWPSHYEDISAAVYYRLPYRTAWFRNRQQTVGPDIDRIARSVLFVRPGLVFVFDAFRQDEAQPASYIRTNFHFWVPNTAPETAAPTTANSNRDVIVTNSPSRLWGHMSYPTAPATNSVALFDGRARDSYCWQATPVSTSRDQFFLHVFRAGDTTGFGDPSFEDFTDTNVFGCLVSGLETAEGSQVCGVIVDNGTDTPPASVSYEVPQTGACYHYVAGLKKNTSYTIAESLAAGTASVTVTEGAGVTTGAGGILRFEVV